MAKAVRTSISLPAGMYRDVDQIASRLNITRSALLAELLTEPLSELRKLVDLVPAKPTTDDVRRLRGASADAIRRAVAQALKEAEQIDPEPQLPL